MQSDEEVGKIGSSVPYIMSKALEMFLESLLKEASEITKSRHARTLTTSHLKIAINNNDKFSLLRDLLDTMNDTQQQQQNPDQPEQQQNHHQQTNEQQPTTTNRSSNSNNTN